MACDPRACRKAPEAPPPLIPAPLPEGLRWPALPHEDHSSFTGERPKWSSPPAPGIETPLHADEVEEIADAGRLGEGHAGVRKRRAQAEHADVRAPGGFQIACLEREVPERHDPSVLLRARWLSRSRGPVKRVVHLRSRQLSPSSSVVDKPATSPLDFPRRARNRPVGRRGRLHAPTSGSRTTLRRHRRPVRRPAPACRRARSPASS